MDGWRCCVCGRGVSPDQKTCDHGGSFTFHPPVFLPIWPYQPGTADPPPGWPTTPDIICNDPTLSTTTTSRPLELN
jgi:hypothetical protein